MHVEPAVGIRYLGTPAAVSGFAHEAVAAVDGHVEGGSGFAKVEGFVDVEVAIA